jgi:hypothetical protein
LGYLRALGEAGSDDLSTFDAERIRCKIEARHSPIARAVMPEMISASGDISKWGYQQVVILASNDISKW